MRVALKRFPKAASLLRKITGRTLHWASIDIPKLTLGSEYGSHTIPASGLTSTSIVYSFGVGSDISFDLEVMQRFGCSVNAFDPTPRSLEWIRTQVPPKGFNFHAIGIGDRDATTAFSPPERDANVSYSPLRGDAAGIELPVRRLSTIMSELGHDRVDLLKLDIEGFEYGVLRDILASGNRPPAIAVEFHHRMYGYTNSDTQEAVAALEVSGYRLFHVSDSGREYSFILR